MAGSGHIRAMSDGKGERRLPRVLLPAPVAFGAAAVIAFLAFAANAAASPLYRVYEAQFRFSAITLTLLFTVYIVVLLVTLLFVGSLSDYAGRCCSAAWPQAPPRADCSCSRTGSGCCSGPACCKVSRSA